MSTRSKTDAVVPKSFVEQAFQKRDCCQFVRSVRDHGKCGCGRTEGQHSREAFDLASLSSGERWTISRHTATTPTDSFGTIEFQGGPHPHKAQYVRLGFDSEPDQILHLFENIWDIERPKLVISVHGGIANFNLQPKLARVFRKGLLKAAKTTGAWILTSGLNAGVVRYVASAVSDGGGMRAKKKIVTIGIAPWGLLKKREDFVGKDITVPYHPQAFSPKSRFAVLNDKHSYFLLVDNGTVGRYGADIILRKRFEEFISKQTIESSGKRVPVVCVVLEGGTCTIRAVLDYVTNSPPVPVVVCDGSGRAADLLAFTHHYVQEDGTLAESIKEQLISLIEEYFGYSREQACKVYMELLLCVRKKHLLTVFRLGEDTTQDIDHAILTALLKGQDLSAPDQLSLALTWNRVDIARTDIFVYGQEWPVGALESAMLEALIYDRVDFVRLLLENGVSMEKFLTYDRLEELYNTDKGPAQSADALRLIVQDVVKYHVTRQHKFTLHEIGLVMQKLIGGAYRAQYCRKEFKKRCKDYREQKAKQDSRDKSKSSANFIQDGVPLLTVNKCDDVHDEDKVPSAIKEDPHFKYPFNELLLWAVLMRRQEMALCMWQHGEEALAKALIATRLYKSMAKEAAEDYLEVEICDELSKCAEEFRKLAFELLEQCYQTDDDSTYQLLTYELANWGRQTCLSLSAMANHKEFLAHPGCQILLADLWHGGLRIRRNSNLKVLMGLFCPLTIVTLEFKTKDELLLQPQTKEEFIEEIREGDSQQPSEDEAGSDVEAGSTSSESSDPLRIAARQRSRTSTMRGSRTSLNFIKTMSTKAHGLRPGRRMSIMSRTLSRSTDDVQLTQAQAPTTVKEVPESPIEAAKNGGVGVALAYSSFRNAAVAALTPSSRGKSVRSLQSSSNKMQQTPLSLGKKFYEFYVAPITTFWSFTISYLLFLVLFTYIVLVKTTMTCSWPELYVIVYIMTYFLELIRKVLMAQPLRLSEKIRLFAQQRWNLTAALATLLFLVALVLRFIPETKDVGRVLYCCDIVYWYLQLLDLMSVSKILGPYITMVTSMCYICTILMVVLMAFGVVRQSILFPEEEFQWQLVRNIFYKPYFMLYGEVYAPEIDIVVNGQPAGAQAAADSSCLDSGAPHCSRAVSPACGDDNTGCVVGGWITPAFMAAFLLVANILLINLIIAVFNNIFFEVNAVSQEVWKFRRYYVVMEYEQKPFLPPPLIIFSHMYLLYKYCCRRNVQKKSWISDYGLKLFLNDEDVEKLHDFEEECMDELFRKRDVTKLTSSDERLRRTTDRVEFISMKLDDMAQKHNVYKSAVETKLKHFEELMEGLLSSVQALRTDLVQLGVSAIPTPPRLRSVTPSTSDARTKRVWTSGHDASEDTASAMPIALRKETPPLRKAAGADKVSPFVWPKVALNSLSETSETSPPNTLFTLATIDSSKAAELTVGGASDDDQDRCQVIEDRAANVDDDTITQESVASLSPGAIGRTRSLPMHLGHHGVSMKQPRTYAGQQTKKYSLAVPNSPPSPSIIGGPSAPSAHPRHAEYTTITDCIDTSAAQRYLSPQTPFVTVSNHVPLNEHDFVEGNAAELLGGLRRAKPSAVFHENSILREYEEYGSVITGGLVQGRMQGGQSLCLTDDELREMGMDELELQEYLACLDSQVRDGLRAGSSSAESLDSSKVEDRDGFQQINECLMQKDVARCQASSSGLGDAAAVAVTTSAPSGSGYHTPAAPRSPTVSSFTNTNSSPLGSPKAGLAFSFDHHDIQEHLRQADEETRLHRQRRQQLSDDEI